MAAERHEEEQAEKAFTVSDKRLFTKEGSRRDPDTPRVRGIAVKRRVADLG